ncbi:MAG: V-type ATP synthase subunit D [Ruminiclostridium sp.]|nr:V-type ATP synthase subunit D [Ruminiclostridium sp.]
MAEQVFPTKGNLIKTKRSLQQAKQGYELMDRKRNVLIREMVTLIDKSKLVRDNIEQTYEKAYLALQKANLTLGSVSTLTQFVPEENGLEISFRSVMGVELPTVILPEKKLVPQYDVAKTNSYLDRAVICFNETKYMTVALAEIENSIYRLAVAIKKTQKRANALKNIIIPKYEAQLIFITSSLEEKEREEFSRQKVIKNTKIKKEQVARVRAKYNMG